MAGELRAYFFGCVGRPGHCMFSPRGEAWGRDYQGPWTAGEIDGNMQPGCAPGVRAWQTEQLLGVARLHHRDGWTMLSFWDRSVDQRHNSNGNFIIEGEHTFDELVALARETFPGIWNRVVTQPGTLTPGSLVPERRDDG